MSNIKNEILSSVSKRLRLRDRIFLWTTKRYTYKIYKMGYRDAYNRNRY